MSSYVDDISISSTSRCIPGLCGLFGNLLADGQGEGCVWRDLPHEYTGERDRSGPRKMSHKLGNHSR
jgi:transposase